MSDSNKNELAQEAEVDTAEIVEIETTAEEPTEPVGAEEPIPAPQQAPKAPSTAVPTTLALLALVGLGGGGYWFWQSQQVLQQQLEQQVAAAVSEVEATKNAIKSDMSAASQALDKKVDSKLQATQGNIGAVQQELQGQQAAFDSTKKELEQAQKNLEQREAQVKAEIAGVHERIGRSNSQWMAAEAEYLIRVANHRVRLERDVVTAMEAMQGADDRLKATADPYWTKVREALASEISQLRTAAKLDTIGLAASLASLAKRVDELRLKGAQPITPGGKALAEGVKIEGLSVQEILAEGWKGFKSMMEVRRLDKPVTAMMPPEQRYFVYQNLRLQLEAARLAVLRADPDLYASSLKTTEAWIKEFIILEDAVAQTMLEEIVGLAKTNIRPELPDISNSLRLLRDLMQNGAITRGDA